jgi:uncharacterized protein
LTLRFLIRLRETSLPGERLLTSVRMVAKTLGVSPRNPKWTSYGALELDVFTPSRADFDLFVSAVSPLAEVEFTKDLNLVPLHKSEPRLFDEARRLFNDERYWECHEVLEGVWRTKQGKEKNLLQGIILVCAAFVHHQKGEEAVALGVLGRAIGQLDFDERRYGGFDVKELKRNVDDIIQGREFTYFKV